MQSDAPQRKTLFRRRAPSKAQFSKQLDLVAAYADDRDTREWQLAPRPRLHMLCRHHRRGQGPPLAWLWGEALKEGA